jgi:hypothetical protein
MSSLVVSISGPGNPVYSGPPSPLMVRVIQAYTFTDKTGKRFYRTSLGGETLQDNLYPLRTEAGFSDLNAILDCYR